MVTHDAPKRGKRAVYQTTALDRREAVERLGPRLGLQTMNRHRAEGAIALLFEQASTARRPASRRQRRSEVIDDRLADRRCGEHQPRARHRARYCRGGQLREGSNQRRPSAWMIGGTPAMAERV